MCDSSNIAASKIFPLIYYTQTQKKENKKYDKRLFKMMDLE